MANRKFKMTAFARFIIIMLFAAPIAYMAASYYNGEDGIENIKSLFQGNIPSISQEDVVETTSIPTDAPSAADVNAEVARLNDELLAQDRALDSMHFENGELKLEIKEQREEIDQLKAVVTEMQARIEMMEGQE